MQSFMAYLVLRSGRPQLRSHLSFVFWPDSEEKQAQTNLRNLLHKLKQALPVGGDFLDVNSQTITWKKRASYSLDVEKFEIDLFEASEGVGTSNCEKAIESMEAALTLYRGVLLENLYDDWLAPVREHLQLSLRKGLIELLEFLKEREKYKQAVRFAKVLVQTDSISEVNQYCLIESLALNQDAAAALLAFNAYEIILKKELDIEPGEALQALCRKIGRGDFSVTELSAGESVKGDIAQEESSSEGISSIAVHTPWFIKFGWFAVVASIITIAFVFLGRKTALDHTLEKSIAVLPFENRSQLQEDIFFVDGIHDDLITQISHIHEVKVISRSSVAEYKDTQRNLEEVAKELGVRTVIEGGVQRSGDMIRINIQLIDGATGFQLWSESYTRSMNSDNIFGIQSEITEAIAEELEVLFTIEEKGRIGNLPTKNFEAMEAYFHGNYSQRKLSSGGLKEAVGHYRKAIELDPRFASAYARLAIAYIDQIYYSGESVDEQLALAEPLIDFALEFDGDLSEAYRALGLLRQLQNNPSESEAAYQRAIELNPNNAEAYNLYAHLKHWVIGDIESSLGLNETALDLDPQSFKIRREIAQCLQSLTRFDEAKAHLESLLREDSNNVENLTALGMLYKEGYFQFDEAIYLFRKAYVLDPTNSNLCSSIAASYEAIGDRENSLFWTLRDLALAPDSQMSTYLRGMIHDIRGEFKESLAMFSKLRASDKMYYVTVYRMAAADIRLGNGKEAYKRYRKAYPELDAPDFQVTAKNAVNAIDYAYLLHLKGEQGRAEILAKKVLKILPSLDRFGDFGAYRYFDAGLYILLGEKEKAIGAVREFVEMGGGFNIMIGDIFLEEIADEAEYIELMRIVQERLAVQRKRLNEMEANNELAAIP